MKVKDILRKTYITVYKKYYAILYRISEKKFLEKKFYSVFGYKINWENPKTFSEKQQWLKLYWKSPMQPICADKYAVREYVEKKIGENILNDLIAVYDNVEDIKWDELPEKFVLKVTHGSGMNIICHDKNNLNIKESEKKLKKWLQTNYEERSGEWLYRDIPRRIVCEKYLENNSSTGLTDYKFWCANGIPRMIQVDFDRYGDHKKIQYDTEWNKIELSLNSHATDGDIEKPSGLSQMMKYATILSNDFPFARVDFYEVEEKIYFGEITFFPGAGLHKFDPKELDELWGNWIELPNKIE